MTVSKSLLECGHEQLWARDWQPAAGSRVWCFRCQDMRKVVAAPGTFIASCRTMHCRYYAVRKRSETIRSQVTRHLADYPAHVVQVTDYGTGERVLIRATEEARKYGRDSQERMF